MKKFSSRMIQAALCSVILITLTALPGCGTEHASVPENICELSLTEMWDDLADAAGIKNADTELESFRLYADGMGKIETVSLEFRAVGNNGKAETYYVNMKPEGTLYWQTGEGELSSRNRHPRDVFFEIDKLGLDSIDYTEDGLSIDIEYVSGDIGYHHEYLDIYHLEDGTLQPLEEIIFHTTVPWCTISVYNLISGGTDGDTTTVERPVPDGERTTQIWFLSNDLLKAETVQFPD